MAFNSAQVARVLIGDYHYSPVLADFSFSADVDFEDVSTINDTTKQMFPTLSASTFSGSGWVDTDGAANAHIDQLGDWLGDTATPLTWCPSGTTLGAEATMVLALESNFMVGSKVASVSEWSLAGQNGDRTDFGKSLHALQARTTTSQETAVDNTASSPSGGVAHLHVTAFSGFTSVAVIVEHSTDNSSFSTLASFTSAAGTTSERVTVSSSTTVNRYVRAKWTVTGSGSITFHVAFARR